jgi:AcrR family transcriptional regulator
VTTPVPAPSADRATAGGEQTKRLIVETAIRLFREHGYDKTTMRAIASEAGLSVGNAYYYFPSKDHLVQEFYVMIQHEHRQAAAEVLATETQFARRLHGVLTAALEVIAPYHGFAGKFIKVAADPASPLSPFSDDSDPAREISMQIYRDLVAGTTTKIDPELRDELPDLLWLSQLAVTLFWVHDRSPGQTKTRLLVDRAVPLADRLIALSRLRVLRSATREGLALYRVLRS